MRGILTFLVRCLGSTSIGLYDDNKGAIDSTENPSITSNCKHMDVRYHFLRELVTSGDILVPVSYTHLTLPTICSV